MSIMIKSKTNFFSIMPKIFRIWELIIEIMVVCTHNAPLKRVRLLCDYVKYIESIF